MQIVCTTDSGTTTCNFPQTQTIQNSNGDTFYLENNFTYGDIAICFFLCVIILAMITAWIAEFFQAKVVAIKKKL
jgi:hypothetical protein